MTIYAIIQGKKAALTENTEVVAFATSAGFEVIELTVVRPLIKNSTLPVQFYLNTAVEMLDYPFPTTNVCRFLVHHLGVSLSVAMAIFKNLQASKKA